LRSSFGQEWGELLTVAAALWAAWAKAKLSFHVAHRAAATG